MSRMFVAIAIALTCSLEAAAFPMAEYGTARADYNPATGVIRISANGVINWYIEHAGHASMTGDPPLGLPGAGGLFTDNDIRFGESHFARFSYDLNLGAVAAAGIPDDGTLQIFPQGSLGESLQSYPLEFVPEPTTIGLLVLGLCVVVVRRQRN